LLLAWVILQPAYADAWQPITETTNLQALVAGATAEIQLEPGVIAAGEYHADGSAEIKAWNETFHRIWVVYPRVATSQLRRTAKQPD
jgi:hypothetical protein